MDLFSQRLERERPTSNSGPWLQTNVSWKRRTAATPTGLRAAGSYLGGKLDPSLMPHGAPGSRTRRVPAVDDLGSALRRSMAKR